MTATATAICRNRNHSTSMDTRCYHSRRGKASGLSMCLCGYGCLKVHRRVRKVMVGFTSPTVHPESDRLRPLHMMPHCIKYRPEVPVSPMCRYKPLLPRTLPAVRRSCLPACRPPFPLPCYRLWLLRWKC